MKLKSELSTPDGVIIAEKGTHWDAKFGAPYQKAILSFDRNSFTDYQEGFIQDCQEDDLTDIITLSRSGTSIAGINIVPNGLPQINGKYVEQEADVYNLNKELPRLLGAIDGSRLGKLYLRNQSRRIKKRGDIEQLIKSGLILLEKGSYKIEDSIDNDGSAVITLPLLPVQYITRQRILKDFSNSDFKEILNGGRASTRILASKQTDINMDTLKLTAGDFFVGEIRISLGDIDAVIKLMCDGPENANVMHLSARLLDAFRTQKERHVELYKFFNGLDSAIPLSQIKVVIELYRHDNPLKLPVGLDYIKQGYPFEQIVQPEKSFERVLNFTSAHPAHSGYYASVLADGRYKHVPWEIESEESHLEDSQFAQDALLLKSAKKICEHEPGDDNSKQHAELAARLNVFGGIKGKAVAVSTMPNEDTLSKLKQIGIGTVIFRNAQANPDDSDKKPKMSFFSPEQIQKMMTLTHSKNGGMQFYKQSQRGEWEVFHKGLFMKPENRERFDKARYWFAFYGSHMTGNVENDRKEVEKFISKLAKKYGGAMGITNGGGAGIMELANTAALNYQKEVEDINDAPFSAAVSIDLSSVGQIMSPEADGSIGYTPGNRFPRQHYMDRLSNIAVINAGGFGTFEELTSTICSMKLVENSLAPIILINPDGKWDAAIDQIKTIIGNNMGPPFIENLVCNCKSYDEAYTVTESFLDDPNQWYEDHDIPMDKVELGRKAQRVKSREIYIDDPEDFSKGFKEKKEKTV